MKIQILFKKRFHLYFSPLEAYTIVISNYINNLLTLEMKPFSTKTTKNGTRPFLTKNIKNETEPFLTKNIKNGTEQIDEQGTNNVTGDPCFRTERNGF